MWVADTISWQYGRGKVLRASATQSSGYVFPNIARNRGIKRYARDKGDRAWRYRGNHSFSAGIPTPWGDIQGYSERFSLRYLINGDGYWMYLGKD